jgi:hypothetical protein
MAYWECKPKGCSFFQRLNHIKGNPDKSLVAGTIVTKTHVTDVDQLQATFGSYFDNIFFIGNERKDEGKLLPRKYCAENTYLNVTCLEYNDLQYDDEESLRHVVRYVMDKIKTSFPYFTNVELKEEEAVQRLLDMGKSYKGIPGYNSDRYGVGGGGASNHTL